jgi:chemotaxis protein MotB
MPPRKKGNESTAPTIIIIKKKVHDTEGGHHGGTWKIAYADFMTAMMAFFLVMWLVSTASKEQITRLASYFNPVKLSDRNPAKGVHDNEAGTPEEKAEAARAEKAEKKAEKPSKKSEAEKKPDAEKKPETEKHQSEDEQLFTNPFGVLTQLASQAEGAMAVVMAQGQGGNAMSDGASHDPFTTDPVIGQSPARAAPPPAQSATPKPDASAASHPAEAKADHPSDDKHPKSRTAPEPGEQLPTDKALEAATQLGKELGRLIDSLPKSFRPNISTKATAEGVLVSLTDDLSFNMFKVASAEPSPQLVLVLERIGTLINKHPGKLVVRGHTDARKYAGDAHGNWRLSVNRANMAYYMLLRAKVEDNRFLAVEGYADRNLRNKTDPLAAENRRIEILIKGAES